MAILGFIIVVAGRAFSDATGMRVRSQNMLASAEEAGRVSALLKEDISQMGAKSWGDDDGSGKYIFLSAKEVHINYDPTTPDASGTDLSSYNLTPNSPEANFDKLEFLKAHYDKNGVCEAVFKITWEVNAGKKLLRKCEIEPSDKCSLPTTSSLSECPPSPDNVVEMASNVKKFKLYPSLANVSDTLYSSINPAPPSSFPSWPLNFKCKHSDGTPCSITGGILNDFISNPLPTPSSAPGTLHTNFYLANNPAGGTGDECYPFDFEAGEEYAIEFKLPLIVTSSDPCLADGTSTSCSSIELKYNKMVMFQAGRDHLSVGLRNPDMEGEHINNVSDFLFYPPQSKKEAKDIITHHFGFSVPASPTSACIGITAAFYGDATKDGHLDITDFKVYKTNNIYKFDDIDNIPYPTITPAGKASVKAFKLILEIEKKSEVNRAETVIPVPNNGVVPTGGY